jgi:hypothetical protein
MSYLCYLCSSLPPVVCMKAHVLVMLFVFVFISSCLYEGTCLIYVICVRLYLQLFVWRLMSYLRCVCLYLQLFVWRLMSYLCYLCLFGSSLPPVVCRRAHVLFMLFVFVFISSCLYEGSCFIYVICVRLYLQLFVGGLMSFYLCYLCSSLSPVVCMKAHVLFMLFVFVFTSSCL